MVAQLKSVTENPGSVNSVLDEVQQQFSLQKTPFHGVSSQYLENKYFRRAGSLIIPRKSLVTELIRRTMHFLELRLIVICSPAACSEKVLGAAWCMGCHHRKHTKRWWYSQEFLKMANTIRTVLWCPRSTVSHWVFTTMIWRPQIHLALTLAAYLQYLRMAQTLYRKNWLSSRYEYYLGHVYFPRLNHHNSSLVYSVNKSMVLNTYCTSGWSTKLNTGVTCLNTSSQQHTTLSWPVAACCKSTVRPAGKVWVWKNSWRYNVWTLALA